jgi:hypothetical protein
MHELSAASVYPLRMARQAAALGCAFAFAFAASARDAGAQTKNECSAAYEEGQTAQHSSKLLKAQQALSLCMRAACPAFIRADCSRWYEEVSDSMPTIVLHVVGPTGADDASARVTMDGVAAPTDGRAVPADPGPHVFEAKLGDGSTQTRSVIVLQGQKDQRIDIAFPSSQLRAEAGGGTRPVDRLPAGARPIPPLAWALGGVGVVGLGVFAGFGLASVSAESRLRDECKPVCSSDEVRSVKTQQAIADIGLAVGIAALVSAVVVVIARPTVTVTAGVAQSRHGIASSLAATF